MRRHRRVLVAVVLGLNLVARWRGRGDFWTVDRCLDSGGRRDPESRALEGAR